MRLHDSSRNRQAAVGGEARAIAHNDLTFQAFDVPDKPGRQLVIYQAEPGSPNICSVVPKFHEFG